MNSVDRIIKLARYFSIKLAQEGEDITVTDAHWIIEHGRPGFCDLLRGEISYVMGSHAEGMKEKSIKIDWPLYHLDDVKNILAECKSGASFEKGEIINHHKMKDFLKKATSYISPHDKHGLMPEDEPMFLSILDHLTNEQLEDAYDALLGCVESSEDEMHGHIKKLLPSRPTKEEMEDMEGDMEGDMEEGIDDYDGYDYD